MPATYLPVQVNVFLRVFLIVLLASLTHAAPPPEPPPVPMREFRASWIATVHNLDWPSSGRLSAAAQKAELVSLLDRAQRLKLNAVILQVRPSSDALYKSSLEPWSGFLTGAMGVDPGYDPLAFAIAEAHRRGLQLHAWFNPFRALATKEAGVSSGHVVRRHPEWIRSYGTQMLLDPGIPAVREYVQRVILDVVRRYDIDGVHLDDYFYPYPLKGEVFADGATWRKYGGGLEKSEWRRQNINRFVSSLYQAIKNEKQSVLFGISPFGIWRPGVPASIKAGIDAYETLGCDAPLWLRNGWVDYLAPQLYWPSEPADQSFPVLYHWWASQNSKGRHLWPGIATERIGAKRSASEQVRQILTVRRGGGDPGHIHWSNKSLARNQGGIATLLSGGAYSQPAIIPLSPWLDRSAPAAPVLTNRIEGGTAFVDWSATPSEPSCWLVQWKGPAGWTTQIVGTGSKGIAWPGDMLSGVAVRAVSRTGGLSEAVWLKR